MPLGQSFGFVGPAYVLDDVAVDGQDAVNLYPKLVESGDGASKASRYAYFSRPGLTGAISVPGGCRALTGGNNRLFAVGGANLYELTSGSAVLIPGTMGSSSGPAQIIIQPFGVSAAIVVYDGTDGTIENVWVFDGVTPPDAGVISAVGIGYIDGYTVALRPPSPPGDPDGLVPINTLDGNQINLSDLLNPRSWDPLQYAIRSGAPDQVQQIYTPGSIGGPGPEELWWLGKRTTEVWYNTGGSSLNPFPFQRVPGAFIGQGLWAANSVVALRNSLMFLGGDDRGVGVVWRMAGYQPQRVSTHAIERIIQSYAVAGSDISSAIAYGEQFEGHDFYVLTFPGQGTLVYDVTEGLWHRRSTGGVNNPYLGVFHAWTLGKHYVGALGGDVYIEDPTVYQDSGSPITWQRTAPHLNLSNKWNFYKQFELQYGGLPADTRTYSLALSRDKGYNFGTPKSQTLLGTERFVWRTLGRSRDLVVKVTSTDNLPQAIVDGYIDSEPGTGN